MATGADIRPHRIVVVGGGFGGIARDTLRRDFRRIDPRSARILPLEGTDRVLPAFPPVLSAKAKRSLERLGVTVALDALVTDVDREGVTVRPRQGRAGRIPTRTVLWTAGGRPPHHRARDPGRASAAAAAGRGRREHTRTSSPMRLPASAPPLGLLR
jgi:NADH dehydrogenase FAD-containing subunit